MNSTSKIPSGITNDINSTPISKDISSSIFGSSSASSSPSSESISSSKNGFFMNDGKTNYTKIGLVVIILLFFGVNLFSYLGDFLQKLKEIAAPFFKDILESLGYAVTETTKDVTNIAAKGAKLGIDVAAGTVESGVDVIQGQLDLEQSGNSSQQQQQQQSSKSSISASLTSALANAEENTEPLPDDAMSSTQRNGTGKSGYCYIGEDRGFRSCISVSENDTCMSGDIFPSQEICVNPSLRE